MPFGATDFANKQTLVQVMRVAWNQQTITNADLSSIGSVP